MFKKLIPVVALLFLAACACPHFSSEKASCCKGGMCIMDGKSGCCQDANKDGKCDCCKSNMCVMKDGKCTMCDSQCCKEVQCCKSGMCMMKDGMKASSDKEGGCPMCLKAAKDKAAATKTNTSSKK
jgi:hypothetical protein